MEIFTLSVETTSCWGLGDKKQGVSGGGGGGVGGFEVYKVRNFFSQNHNKK